jgi:hypothetical protein
MDSNATADQPLPPAADGDPLAEAPAPPAPAETPDEVWSPDAAEEREAQGAGAAAEQAEAGLDASSALAALAILAAQAGGRRLSPPDEEKAAQLVQSGLSGSKEDLAKVAALLPQLGWSIAVKGATGAWPALKAASRTAFLKILAADGSESGRRIRLSLARGLFKIPDLPACQKLLLGVCKEMREKKTGDVSQKEAANFASVMIGKGKPWIAQIALADLKPADADLLVHCAVFAAFAVPGPPVTPLGVLKWAAEAGRIGALHETAIAVVSKHVSRWSAKWAEALRKEVPGLPEQILASLKSPPSGDLPPAIAAEIGEASEPVDAAPEEASADAEAAGGGISAQEPAPEPPPEDEPPKRKERPVYVSKTIPAKESPQRGAAEAARTAPTAPAAQGQPREPREPREPKGSAPRSFAYNAADALRQLESHISWLKHELAGAEKKLRTREDDRRQPRRKPEQVVIEGEPTPEELAKLNLQLDHRISELQARIADLTADAEARAASQGAFAAGGAEPQPAPDAQLRTLLGLKLAEAFADFSALEKGDRDLVVPQHYRTVLSEVFGVLKAEGIPLAAPQPPEA